MRRRQTRGGLPRGISVIVASPSPSTFLKRDPARERPRRTSRILRERCRRIGPPASWLRSSDPLCEGEKAEFLPDRCRDRGFAESHVEDPGCPASEVNQEKIREIADRCVRDRI